MTIYPDITLKKDFSKGTKYNYYQVREDSYYESKDLLIPEGFVTDFSSVPRIIWSLIPPHGKAMAASVLHDYMYTYHPHDIMLGEKAGRYWADNLFYDLLIAHGIGKFQAKLMYLAVRWFGAKRYTNKGNRT